MQLYEQMEKLPSIKRVVVLGNFDGVHLGHRELLQLARKIADEKNMSMCVFTFYPQAQEIFDQSFLYLATKKQKLAMFAELGVDEVISVPFDENIAKISPEDFAQRILIGKLNSSDIVVGFNYTFGYQGKGKALDLQKLLHDRHIMVHIVPRYEIDGEIVSSSLIRQLLLTGEIEKANQLLGYQYTLAGEVVKGRQVGRTIGIPTANIQADDKVILPKRGVYAVKAYLADKEYLGVLNIGKRPTVHNGTDTTIEVHLLDFDEDIYGEILRVDLYKYLRGETKFVSLTELKQEIEHNVAEVREIFS